VFFLVLPTIFVIIKILTILILLGFILLIFVGALFLKLILSITSLLIQNGVIQIEGIDILKGSAEKFLNLIENPQNKELNDFLASIVYILSFISPPIVLVLLKKNEFFKFHCIYSLTSRVFLTNFLSIFFSSFNFLMSLLALLYLFLNCLSSYKGFMAPSAFDLFLSCALFYFLLLFIIPLIAFFYITSFSVFPKLQQTESIDNFSSILSEDENNTKTYTYHTEFLFNPIIGFFLPYFIPIWLLFSLLSAHSVIKPYVKKLLQEKEKIDYNEEFYKNPIILAITFFTKSENKPIEDHFIKILALHSLDYHYRTIFRIVAYTTSFLFLLPYFLYLLESTILYLLLPGWQPYPKFLISFFIIFLIILSLFYSTLRNSIKKEINEYLKFVSNYSD